jgi:hypothetical protein
LWETITDEYYARDASGKEMVSIAIPSGLFTRELRLISGTFGDLIILARLMLEAADSFI